MLRAMLIVGCAGVGCNQRVFEEVHPQCSTTLFADVNVDVVRPVDILMVLDSSGTMAQEQADLARNFLNPDINECPIGTNDLDDFARCDEDAPPAVCRFLNPDDEELAPGGALSRCGFVQVLAAYENDFRIGIITTDVSQCDDNGVPQRGCLQPALAPAGDRVIARADLFDDNPANDNLGERFAAALASIGTAGSQVERGLDAAQFFLTASHLASTSCEGDLERFLRPEARLAMMFISDENDCSHGDEPLSICPAGTSCEPGFEEFVGDACDVEANGNQGGVCYEDPTDLLAVTNYAEVFRGLKNPGDVQVAVIAGGVIVNGEVVGGACRVDDQGLAENDCVAPLGRLGCGDDNCCVADAGDRYFALADELGGVKNSICVDSFQSSLIQIARSVAAAERLQLREPPSSEQLIAVERASGDAPFSPLQRLSDDASCETNNGWILEGDGRSIRLCGSARPGPGDRLRVRASGGDAAVDESCRR
jgi:hypothetical protein